jgi:hypothetical protein
MDGLIRKIIIGQNPKDAMAYYVGMKAGRGEVSAIVFDESALYHHSVKRYSVYIQTDDGQLMWKCIEDMPVIVEFDLNF